MRPTWRAVAAFMPPYQLVPDATAELEATLRREVGPR